MLCVDRVRLFSIMHLIKYDQMQLNMIVCNQS